MTPKSEEEALLMYAAGLEYLKRTKSKLLPAVEVEEPKKKAAQVDFSLAMHTSRIRELEARIRQLETELMIAKSQNRPQPFVAPSWPNDPIFGNNRGYFVTSGTNPDDAADTAALFPPTSTDFIIK